MLFFVNNFTVYQI